MAQHASAMKRIRQSERRRIRNKAALSKMKTLVKKVRTSKTKAEAETHYRRAVQWLDRIAAQGIIHENNASNQKSKLTMFVNKLPEKSEIAASA